MTNKQLNQCLDLSTFTTPLPFLRLQQSQHHFINFHRFNARYLCGGGALTSIAFCAAVVEEANDRCYQNYPATSSGSASSGGSSSSGGNSSSGGSNSGGSYGGGSSSGGGSYGGGGGGGDEYVWAEP